VAGPDGAFLRGGHWRNFLVKYPEANRMHKKMLALSALCTSAGTRRPRVAPSAAPSATTPTGTGVRGTVPAAPAAAIWRNLALAEGELRRGEG